MMTFKEFIEDLQQELKDNPEFGDLPVLFHTANDMDMLFLSIYDNDIEEIGNVVNIDIGYDDE